MKKISRKTIIYILIIVGIIILILLKLNYNKQKNDEETAVAAITNDKISVQIDTVKYTVLNLSYKSDGVFTPLQELNLSAEQSGRVAKVYVDIGDNVKIGQALALIKTDELSVNLENMRVAYNTAKTNSERYQNAYKTGGVTKQQLDQALMNLENAKANFEQARIKYGDATIKSTINGIVNKRDVEPGTVVNSGTNLFELVNVSKLKLKTTVNETQIVNLQKGDTVTITASVFPEKEFIGIVTFIAPKANSALNFPIEVEVQNSKNSLLKAGMYGSINFEVTKNKVLTVNKNAFVGSLSNQEVFVMKPDSTVILKKVISGIISDKNVEIIEGLKLGDRVIISGQINLQNGSKVSLIN
ncbi:efflux RND transporter periplasmic adaptor subunit [Lutibacter aestuarii]|uniref:Efflux RND transporter periplasmic adaptor subunit n=1 Tax=Lutibacter aestuarii TaxID=861111 RepID=A0ABW2Z9G7_9FLAO